MQHSSKSVLLCVLTRDTVGCNVHVECIFYNNGAVVPIALGNTTHIKVGLRVLFAGLPVTQGGDGAFTNKLDSDTVF